MKLGKLQRKYSAKTLNFSKYCGTLLPPPPPEKIWREYKVPADAWQMFGNDRIGDCTVAAIAHMLMLVTAHTGKMVTPTEGDVTTFYSAVSGYDPATGLNDNGAAITDVLERWRTTGIAGHKILGWAELDQTNIAEIKQAIWLFGGIDIGVQLPNIAQQQFGAGEPWTLVPDDGGIDGGHSVPLFGYGALGTNCETWAKRQGMNWDWFLKYCDEAYAVITPDWFDQISATTPSGIDLATLEADLKALSQ